MTDAGFAEVGSLQSLVESAAAGGVTVLWYGDHTAGVEPERFAGTHAVVGFELWRALNIAELWTNTLGEYVPLAWALDGLKAVLAGNADEALLRTIAGTHLYIRRQSASGSHR